MRPQPGPQRAVLAFLDGAAARSAKIKITLEIFPRISQAWIISGLTLKPS